jgi:hypothetical protein
MACLFFVFQNCSAILTARKNTPLLLFFGRFERCFIALFGFFICV